jgi:PA14 domain
VGASSIQRALLLTAGAAALLLLGVPLGPTELLLGAGVLYAALALPLPGTRAVRWVLLSLVAVTVLRVALAATMPPTGFVASYWTGPRDKPPERSTEFLGLSGATRIDRALDLTGDQFPVGFFNDAARFNFGPDIQPGRDQLPFSVRWQGSLDVSSDGEHRFALDSMGPARVTLDDVEVLATTDDATRQHVEASARLSAGQHALRVDYTRPEARVPLLRLSWQPRPGSGLEIAGGRALDWRAYAADVGLGLVFAAWLILAVRESRWPAGGREPRRHNAWRAAMGALPLLFLVYGMLLHGPLIGRTAILSGLDDWLVYESSARDILLNGPLMTGGQERAAPYYGQPLYPYALALAHWLTGEGLFGPLALQFAAFGSVVTLAAMLARRAFGSRVAALWTLATVLVFAQVQNEYWRVARQLFNENLYMPLVLACLIVLVGLARRPVAPAWWRVLPVGVLLGVTAISRSQFLAFVPLAVLILAVAWRRNRGVVRGVLAPCAALIAGLVLAIAPVTARNWIVSGQVVPISASGGASLLEFHRPPAGLIDPAALQRDLLFEALHLDTSTRTVLAFARQDPLGYLATWLPLGAHSVGLPGRTGSGVYWPLLAVVLTYLVAFALRGARRLHVWPIHAFVASHLLILMLFEADTYGYRLVMPMYALMLVVAAQVPLALVHSVARRWSESAQRRWSVALGLCAAVLAVGWQARSLGVAWPERETNLVGLGGAAAHAATTAEQVGADAIYVASVDGTPRRFGAGSLPGLRYPWLKWFDPARSLPLPAPGTRAVYALSELSSGPAAGDLVACLGPPDTSAERVVDADQARQQCVATLQDVSSIGATFEGLGRVDSLAVPASVEAGSAAETRLVWQPLVRHPEPQQIWLHLEDAEDGTLWGNATLDLYPARQWEPGEALLSRLPLTTDPTAIPDRYRLTLGMTAARAGAAPVTAAFQGQRLDRVPVGSLALLPSTRELAMQDLPVDMLPTRGVASGGLELLAARPPAPDAWPGKRVRVGLLWRVMHDAPQAARVRLRLVRDTGEVVQESVLPVFGGRVALTTLRGGAVVRDEQLLEVGPNVAGEGLVVQVGLAGTDAGVAVGKISVAGRQHVFDTSSGPPQAVFGARMALLSHQLEPARARAGATVSVRVRWRAEAPMERTYKVFVHVLDARAEKVVAQRDAEPLDGLAPTPGWVTGEVLEDEYRITLPSDLGAGEYPIEVGVYEERSGDRLRLPNGESRLVLATHLEVR